MQTRNCNSSFQCTCFSWLFEYLRMLSRGNSCSSKLAFAWGRSSDHLQRKGYSPQKGLLQNDFWLICSSFIFEFCFLLGPSGEPLSTSFSMCSHSLHRGSNPWPNNSLIQHIFRDGPSGPSRRSETKTVWVNLFPSAQAHRNSKCSRFLQAQMVFAADPLLWVTHFLLNPGTASVSL